MPSLSKIPARIIEPATGASTWAFGSHKCIEYIGVLTKNGRIVSSHHTRMNDLGVFHKGR